MVDEHFLINKKTIHRMVGLLELNGGDVVLEVGAGTGRITKILAKKARVIAVEKDQKMAESLGRLKNVEAIPADGVKAVRSLNFDKICGNLPFTILEPFFRELGKKRFSRGVFIVGREFPEKVKKIAPSLEVMHSEGLDKKVFSPAPKRDAALIVVRPRGVSY